MLSAEGGIYLTQVGLGGAAGRQGLSELLRGAAGLVSRRGCLPGLPGVAALAPGVPLPALHRRGWLATEQRSLGVCRLRTPGVGDGRTIFHRSRSPLRLWFAAAWQMTSQKRGVSA